MKINEPYLLLVIDNCKRVSYVLDPNNLDEEDLIEKFEQALDDVQNSDYIFYYANIMLQKCVWKGEYRIEKENIIHITLHKDGTANMEGKLFLYDEAKNYNLRKLYFNLKLDERLTLENNIELI